MSQGDWDSEEAGKGKAGPWRLALEAVGLSERDPVMPGSGSQTGCPSESCCRANLVYGPRRLLNPD